MGGSKNIALVTGAGSGIGEQVAHALAEAGFPVVCAGRNQEKIDRVAAAIAPNGHALVLDVTDNESVDSLFDRLPADWHRIDVLVNNAGHDVGGRRRFDEGKVEN